MSKWLHLHSDHIKVCLKREKQRVKHSLQDIRRWMVVPRAKTLNTTNDAIQKKDKPKRQTTLTRLFRQHPNKSEPPHTTKSASATTRNTECTSGPSPTRYIQTMLKLRRPKKPDCPATPVLPVTANPIPGESVPLQNSPCDTQEMSTLNITHKIKVPIDRLIKKFERWRKGTSVKTRGNNQASHIPGQLTG